MINTKRIYTIATLNGFSHQDVKWYIAMEFGLSTTKDLNTEQYNQLIKYLDREVKEMADKTFVGNVKATQTQYGELIKIGIPEKDFNAHVKNGWLNVVLKKGKDSGKYYLELDTFVPKQQDEPKQEAPKDSDLPFVWLLPIVPALYAVSSGVVI